MAKPIVIASCKEDMSGMEWGVSFAGDNPELEDYVPMRDDKTAFKLVALIEKYD